MAGAYGDGSSINTDPSGNIFISGIYNAGLVAGNYTINSLSGMATPYLIKYDSNGNVLWANTGVSYYTAYGISVCSDAVGNALLAGNFNGPNITFGTYTLANNGTSNSFLAKYDPNGNVLWAKNPADTSYDYAYSVSCDANNIYVSGTFSNTSLVFGTHTLTSIGGQKMYLVKYDTNGNVLWAKCNSLGEIFGDGEFGVTVSAEANGDTFVTGEFTSPTLVLGTYTLSNGGAKNIFLAKFDTNGNVLWAKSAVGAGNDQSNSVSADGIGNAYITGFYTSSLLTFGTNTITNAGVKNMFLAKYDTNGNLLWVKNSVDSDNPLGYSVSSTSLAVFITGCMNSSVTLGTYSISTSFPDPDPSFVAEYDVNGNVLFAQAFKSGGDDWLTVSADKYCNAYITGDFGVNPFIIGTNTLVLTANESPFTAKLSFSANCQSTIDVVTQRSNSLSQMSVFPNPNSGIFKIQVDDEIDSGELIIINSLGQKMYVGKINQGENSINLNKISNGFYHYIILQNKQQISSGKLLIE
jgi:hypothetical protein